MTRNRYLIPGQAKKPAPIVTRTGVARQCTRQMDELTIPVRSGSWYLYRRFRCVYINATMMQIYKQSFNATKLHKINYQEGCSTSFHFSPNANFRCRVPINKEGPEIPSNTASNCSQLRTPALPFAMAATGSKGTASIAPPNK